MRLVKYKTIPVIVCNYCREELTHPSVTRNSGLESELNFCDYTGNSDLSCYQKYINEEIHRNIRLREQKNDTIVGKL